MRIINSTLMTLITALIILITVLLHGTVKEINKPLEYHYKDFTYMDIDNAMKYHGTDNCIIKEGQEPYFVDAQGREIILFTDSCIEYLYKEKQKEFGGKNDEL